MMPIDYTINNKKLTDVVSDFIRTINSVEARTSNNFDYYSDFIKNPIWEPIILACLNGYNIEFNIGLQHFFQIDRFFFESVLPIVFSHIKRLAQKDLRINELIGACVFFCLTYVFFSVESIENIIFEVLIVLVDCDYSPVDLLFKNSTVNNTIIFFSQSYQSKESLPAVNLIIKLIKKKKIDIQVALQVFIKRSCMQQYYTIQADSTSSDSDDFQYVVNSSRIVYKNLLPDFFVLLQVLIEADCDEAKNIAVQVIQQYQEDGFSGHINQEIITQLATVLAMHA